MIVLYDRDCGFCAWALGWLLRWDRGGRLRPAPIQGPHGEALLAVLAPHSRLRSWHAIDEDGRLFSAGEALTQVLRRLPGGFVLAALTGHAPRITDRAYAVIAENRSTLARALSDGAKSRAWALIAARESRPIEQVAPAPGASCAVAPRRVAGRRF